MTWIAFIAARATNRNTKVRPIGNLWPSVLVLLPALLLSSHAHAVDPPANIRVEQNVLLWDDVAGASKYNIYFFNSAATGANGDFVTTVVGADGFVLSETGFYTVVTISPAGEYSALNAASRVEFNAGSSEPIIDGGFPITVINTQRCENAIAGSTCTAQCARPVLYSATGGACRGDTGALIHHRARPKGFECIVQNDTAFVEADVYCRRP